MTTFYSNPSLSTELDYRRGTLRQAAAEHRLARAARRGARTAHRRADRRA
jgi:hypothetical protein